ncbi:MAG: glucosamine-6-phosphate deaminase [Alphaproteobacteria bacterium]|nr:glucosamine-6-phosphate deaminase [Alphaproteobacteria bacterium]
MQLLTFSDKNGVADYVATYLIERIKSFVPSSEKPFLVLGLPTGSTPIPVYERLVKAYQKNEISFKHIVTFNMDEYVGLSDTHHQSYHYFMKQYLFDFIDIPKEQINILNGMASEAEEECKQYEEKIKSYGGIDIQLGGIGENGHLAFNEPDTPFEIRTHKQRLTDDTIVVNSRFFDKKEDVPTHALTIGLKTIFEAKQVIIMATGLKKSDAVAKSIQGKVTTDCPASMMQNHHNVLFVCDEDAASKVVQK